MKNLEDSHIIGYLVLVLGLGVFFILLSMFKNNSTVSLFISLGGSLFYVLWGIIHHAVERRLHKDIILEYIIIGIFMFLLLSTAIVY